MRKPPAQTSISPPPPWRFRAEGLLWRVVPAGASELLGEERDPGKKRASFFCVELPGGRLKWRGREFGQGWWVGVEWAGEGTAFLHGYVSWDSPLHRGVIAVDLEDGRELWRDEAATFLGVRGGVLTVLKDGVEGPAEAHLDPRTGEPAAPREEAEEKGPITFFPGPGDGDPELERALPGAQQERAGLELLKLPRILIAAVHTRAGGGCGSRLVVIERGSGKPVFSEDLDEGRPGPGGDSFLVHAGQLLYVRARKELCGFSLEGFA